MLQSARCLRSLIQYGLLGAIFIMGIILTHNEARASWSPLSQEVLYDSVETLLEKHSDESPLLSRICQRVEFCQEDVENTEGIEGGKGVLSIRRSEESPSSGTIPAGGRNIPFLSVEVSNTGSASCSIQSLRVRRTGLGHHEDIEEVKVFQGLIPRGVGGRIEEDQMASIRLRSALTLEPGDTATLTIVADISPSAQNNAEHQLMLIDESLNALQEDGLPCLVAQEGSATEDTSQRSIVTAEEETIQKRAPLCETEKREEARTLINQKRSEQNRLPYSCDETLSQIAQDYADLLAQENHFSHTGPDGSTLTQRISEGGYRVYQGAGTALAENLGRGVGLEPILEAFRGSEGHCRALYSERYGEMGIGIATDPNRAGQSYYVLLMAKNAPTPSLVEPVIEEICRP